MAGGVITNFNLKFQKRWRPHIPQVLTLLGTRVLLHERLARPQTIIFLIRHVIRILILQTPTFKFQGYMDRKLGGERARGNEVL
jgi:hypothetical protein